MGVRPKEAEARPSDQRSELWRRYAFVAIEQHHNLVLNIAIVKRDQATTDVFIEGVRHATLSEFQITIDDFGPYKTATPTTLEDRCDFAMLIEVYKSSNPPADTKADEQPIADRGNTLCHQLSKGANTWDTFTRIRQDPKSCRLFCGGGMFDQRPTERGFSGRPVTALVFAVIVGFFGPDILESRLHLIEPVAFAVLIAFTLAVHYIWSWAERPR